MYTPLSVSERAIRIAFPSKHNVSKRRAIRRALALGIPLEQLKHDPLFRHVSQVSLRELQRLIDKGREDTQ